MIDFIRCLSKSSSSKGLKLIYKYQAGWMYIKSLLDIPISTWYHVTADFTLFLVDIEGVLRVMAVKWSAVLAQWLREADFSSDLKAGGTVQQLNYMTDAGLRRLREARFQFLHHKQHQNLPGESRAVLQRQQHQLQSVFLHGCDTFGQRHTVSAGVEHCVLGHVRRTDSCSGCSQTRKLKVRSEGKISVFPVRICPMSNHHWQPSTNTHLDIPFTCIKGIYFGLFTICDTKHYQLDYLI